MKNRYLLSTVLLTLCFSLLTLFNAQAQTGSYTYTDSWGDAGLQLVNQRSNELSVTYSITNFDIGIQMINGKENHQVMLPSHFLPNNAGAPNLPGNGQYLAIPNGATASFEIVRYRIEIIENVELAPAPVIPLDTDKNPLVYQPRATIYEKDAFYPESPVVLSEETELRGLNMVMLGVTPYQYNPVTKELKVWRDIEVKVTTAGGNATYGTDRLRNRWWDPILKSTVLNPQVLQDIDYGKHMASDDRSEEYEYLIICPNDQEFVNWADTISRFRNMQGIKSGVVTLDEVGFNNPVIIENYIDEIYNNWEVPPSAILILGDYGSSSSNSVTSPIYNNYCASDNIYGDINNDHLPDIVMARMTAQNEEQLEVMVRKFIEYETNPPTSFDFYNHPITALGWQTERWFQICSESVGGFWKNELGKEPVRINEVYDGNPSVDPWSYAQNTSTILNYFGPNGLGYIPATPGELGNWSGGNADDVNNAINNGAFMLQHRDHGNEAGWGEPGYNRNSINGLQNTELTFVWSINCLTGKYNSPSEVFSEKFHRYTHDGNLSGALGLNAASEVSYSFVNDTYVWGMYDYMWPEFMPDYGGSFPEYHGILPAFAMAYGKIFLDHSGWPYNSGSKEVTHNLFHHHGDAFLTVYTEVPQELTIAHEMVITSGEPTYEVTSDLGSLICLSLDGDILAVAEGTGTPLNIEVPFIEPGQYVDVVVTKQNYFRYHEQILAIPPSGPYMLKLTHTLNDENGNQDGFPDYNESLLMTIDYKNVGVEVASDITVSLSSTDPHISFTDAEENLDQVGVDETVILEDAFAFTISDNIPDQHTILIDVLATDGEKEWISTIEFEVNAPHLLIVDFELIELNGNMNGIIDPGEKASLVFTLENSGHCPAANLGSNLQANKEIVAIANDQNSIDMLPIGSQTESVFTFEVDGYSSIGDEVIFSNENSCGSYVANKDVYVKIGVFVEDWETGNLEKFEWLNNSAKPWLTVSDEVYEGAYALRSGHMDVGDFCMLSLSFKTFADDSISFFKKMDTEGNKGELIFIIDGSPQDSWTEAQDWNMSSYALEAGNHIISWIYMYNGESESTENCAWIDLITLPQNPSTIVWAGADQTYCGSEDFTMDGVATYYTSLNWLSSGTGEFSNAGELDAIYHPGEQDFDEEFVILTLEVESTNGEIMANDMQVQFRHTAGDVEIEAAADTVMPVYTESSVYTGTESAFATSYIWTLEPEAAGNLSYDAQTATVTWNLDYSGDALLTYCGSNDCGLGSIQEKNLTIVDAIGVEERSMVKSLVIYPNPSSSNVNIVVELFEANDMNIDIVSTSGINIWSGQYDNSSSVKETIESSQLEKGVYIVVVSTADEKTHKKLVIQ